jgi:carbon-monoxide dehydrogenase medium subunit
MDYIQPRSLKEPLKLARKSREKVTFIGGGTNVIPDMRAGAIKPAVLIDLSHLKNLSYIKEDKKKIRIGALTTISEIASSKPIQEHAPILSQAAQQLGNPLVRNRATIGGNLADASPAADTAVPLLALGAEVVTASEGGKARQVPIDQFFIGPNRTILKKGEIIKEVNFAKPNSKTKTGYFKLGLRNAMAISIASVAVIMEMRNGGCERAKIALGAVAPTPIRAYRTEEMLMGKEITVELIKTCCNEVAKEVRPISDIRASAEYRREMTSVILGRLIRKIIRGIGDAETSSAIR